MKRIAIFLVLQLLASAAGAHRDRLLSLSPTGSIPELPPKYVATRVQMTFSEDGQKKLTRLVFSSAKRRTSIPACLLELVRSRKSNQVSLSGSWYHNETNLPHYVSIKFAEPGQKSAQPQLSGLDFLFSLRDARLIEVMQIQEGPQEGALQYQKIQLTNGCPS